MDDFPTSAPRSPRLRLRRAVWTSTVVLAASLSGYGPVAASAPASAQPIDGVGSALVHQLQVLPRAQNAPVVPHTSPHTSPGTGAGLVSVRGRWRWPVDATPAVLRAFDPPAQRWAAGHRGVDVASSPRALVRSVGEGTVAFAGSVAGRGVVSVQHARWRSTYEPVRASVSAGQRVISGTVLGTLEGIGHCPPAACLHLGLRDGDRYLDPLQLYRPMGVRLLPLGRR